jgi:hypothetical protein
LSGDLGRIPGVRLSVRGSGHVRNPGVTARTTLGQTCVPEITPQSIFLIKKYHFITA